MQFSTTEASLDVIEGWAANLQVTAALTYSGNTNFYVLVEERGDLFGDGQVTQTPAGLSIHLQTSRTLTAGIHLGELRLRFCRDEACTSELPGSPAVTPLRIEVKPNVKVQAPAAMRRAGRDPAPRQELPLDFRPAMGTPQLQLSGATQAFDVQLQGDRVVVNTLQLPAGQYDAQLVVKGSTDARYTTSIDLRYTVEAPAGGERPLTLTPYQFVLSPVQGTVSTHRFRLERPTWTDALEPMTITDTQVVKDVRHLGGDEYEFTVDTRGLPQRPGGSQASYYSSIVARAGQHGGAGSVSITIDVAPPVLVDGTGLSWIVTPATQRAELRHTMAVWTPDGAAVPWSATASKPWLRILQGSGTTGVDSLVVELDAEAAAGESRYAEASITVTIDRPGTLPRQLPVSLLNGVIRFDTASPGVLVGSTGTLRIHGRVQHGGELLPQRGLLQVEGARLLGVRTEEDPRFVGFLGLLAVDLADLVPGTPVTVRVATEVAPTQITVAAAAVPRVPAGYAALPFGSYRAPSYGVGRQTLVFAGPDAVWRWPLQAGVWAAAQASALPGVLDATYAADESVVYALAGTAQVLALDATTLSPLRQGVIDTGSAGKRPDGAAPAGASLLRLGSDGRALVPTIGTSPGSGKGVGWLSGIAAQETSTDIASRPFLADPGTALYWSDAGPTGVALARSSHGTAIAISPPSGTSRIYKGLATQYIDGPVLAGRWITAVSDSGNQLLGNDGLLWMTSASGWIDLRRVVPAGHVAAGFGVTGNGAFALVYGYRVANETGGPRARDARLYMVDLRGGAAPLLVAPSAAATIDLPDAVGCTATPVAGESCDHAAQVLVTPGDASAFVLGPRGVAAVPLATPPAALRARPAIRRLPALRF